MAVELCVLGDVEVRVDGRAVDVGPARQRSVLAALIVDANRTVTTDQLVDRVWGDHPPARGQHALYSYLSRLRRLLSTSDGGDVRLLRQYGGYVLAVEADSVDLHKFRDLIAQARTGPDEDALGLLDKALGMWRGEAFAGVDTAWFNEIRDTLAQQRVTAERDRADVALRLGLHTRLVAELSASAVDHPLDERLAGQLMLALCRSGHRAKALDQYRRFQARLADELGIDPGSSLQRLHQQMLTADSVVAGADAPADTRPAGNLPAELTTFVGRDAELAQVQRLLRTSRMVTLTGVGGVGKTRLALRSAATVAEAPRDGVWLADLAPLAEPGLLDRAVAEALEVRDQSQRSGVDVLVEHLRDKQVLLVLDNCEHVFDSVATMVITLLRAAPGLRVLATSRHALGIPGEHILLVPPLTVPGIEDTEVRGFEAVRLLEDRATASAPDFLITEHNRGAVARLCQRLDGVPLAIELAAVRLSSLSVEEVLERLDDRFRLLSGSGAPTEPRHHQTLRGVVDWSYELCSAHEQLLWARLSVFFGGFDLAAAEAVCGGEELARDEVMDVIAGLVRKSILTAVTSGDRTRYRLLETLRHYGQQVLTSLGQDAALRRRHRDHYQGLVGQAASQNWCHPREVQWQSQLRQELPNIRVAMDFCVSKVNEPQAGLEMAVHLTTCCFFNSSLSEGRHWLSVMLAQEPRPPEELVLAAKSLEAWIAIVQGDAHTAEALLTECHDLIRDSGGGDLPAIVVFADGAYAMLAKEDPSAIPLLDQARDLFRRGGDQGDLHMATLFWALATAFLGDRDAAVAATVECVAEAEAHEAPWAYSWALWCAGVTELRHGKPDLAVSMIRDSLRRQHDIGDLWGPAWGVEALAWTAAALGDHDRAARLLGAAHRQRQLAGVVLVGLFQQANAEAQRQARHALGQSIFATAFAEGADTKDVVSLALAGE